MEKARTLFVVPRNSGCNADCSFCITKNNYENKNWRIEEGEIDLNRLERAIKFAQSFGVIDSKIIGGTEPTLIKPEKLSKIIETVSNYFGQVTMYSNGKNIFSSKNIQSLDKFAKAGLTNLIISRAHYDSRINSELMGMKEYDFEKTISKIIEKDIDIQLSCVLSKEGIGEKMGLMKYLDHAKKLNIEKVIFRELFYTDGETTSGKWINENYVSAGIIEEFMKARKIPHSCGIWDQKIWNYNGIAVTIRPDPSRSDKKYDIDLIYMPDNHLYSSWTTKTSRIM